MTVRLTNGRREERAVLDDPHLAALLHTKSRPSGANAIAVGFDRPDATSVSAKPCGKRGRPRLRAAHHDQEQHAHCAAIESCHCVAAEQGTYQTSSVIQSAAEDAMTPWTPLRGALAAAALLLAVAPRPSGQTQTPTATRPADLVLRGGKIVTVDEARPEAQAMAVTGDTIVALGPIRRSSATSARRRGDRSEGRAGDAGLHRRARRISPASARRRAT